MTLHVLFVCTHNSARSVLAEAMFNHWAARLGIDARAHSAGSLPSGRINPAALAVLAAASIDASGVRSKCWDEFAAPDAPPLAVAITVCDGAAAETCPVFTAGDPARTHWGYPDPSNAPEPERERAFELTRQALGYRILQLLALPLASLARPALQRALANIGRN